VAVSNGFDRIRRLYSIIVEFGVHISVGIKYVVHGNPELSMVSPEIAAKKMAKIGLLKTICLKSLLMSNFLSKIVINI